MKLAVRLLVLAAFALVQPAASLAMTPALLDPAALAGAWTLTGPDMACRLVLKAETASGGEGLALELGDCVRAGLPVGTANHWRVSSDGFGLAAADGSTVLFFSNQGGDRFMAKARDGRRYQLARAG